MRQAMAIIPVRHCLGRYIARDGVGSWEDRWKADASISRVAGKPRTAVPRQPQGGRGPGVPPLLQQRW